MRIRTRWPVVKRTVMVGVVALMVHGAVLPSTLLAQGRPGTRDECRVDISFINASRKITGDVSAECDGWIHSAPWGNWGVNSNTSTRHNGDRFSGWHLDGRHLQWNSCTTEYPYRPNDPDHEMYYSHPPIQRSSVSDSKHASERMRFPEIPCEDVVPDVFTYRNRYMELYELDPYSPDTSVTTLRFFQDIHVPITCTDPWACEGRSAWFSPSIGNSDVTANIQIRVRAYRYRPGRQ